MHISSHSDSFAIYNNWKTCHVDNCNDVQCGQDFFLSNQYMEVPAGFSKNHFPRNFVRKRQKKYFCFLFQYLFYMQMAKYFHYGIALLRFENLNLKYTQNYINRCVRNCKNQNIFWC
jgi:hypothetical protein